MGEQQDSSGLDSTPTDPESGRPFIDYLEELAHRLKSYQQARQRLRTAQAKAAAGQELTKEEADLLESMRDF